jgi:hypothetical protein
LNSEENGQHHGHKTHKDSSHQELLANHFVVLREDVLRNEMLLMMVVILMMSVCVCVV